MSPSGRRAQPKGRRPRGGAAGGRATGRVPSVPGGGRRRVDRGLGGEQVEGRQAVRELLLAGSRRVREVLVASGQDDAEVLSDIVELADSLGVPVREVSRARLDREARTDAPQGVLARAAPLHDHGLDELTRTTGEGVAPFVLMLDGVTDPGNLGAILRTADCAGVTGVVLPRHRAVHVTPAVTKAAAGAVEHLRLCVVGGLPTAVAAVHDAGLPVFGLDASGGRSIFDLPVEDGPVALVLGAEGSGLSRLVRRRCDDVLSIPLGGALASLNVAAAAAVACFEVVRRRSGRR